MNHALELTSQPASTPHVPPVRGVNLARGAIEFGLPELEVLLADEIVRDYAESDAALGYNAVGVILSVLARHLARHPGGGLDDSIAVVLRRRHDGREIELHLRVVRSHRLGGECVRLNKLGECEVPD